MALLDRISSRAKASRSVYTSKSIHFCISNLFQDGTMEDYATRIFKLVLNLRLFINLSTHVTK